MKKLSMMLLLLGVITTCYGNTLVYTSDSGNKYYDDKTYADASGNTGTYEGTLNNGKREGVWKTYFENGNLQWEVTFVNGKQEGIVKDYYESGNLKDEGDLKNNKLDGWVRVYTEDGQYAGRAYYVNGMRYKNKQEYEDSLKDE
jgi:antitoxin component YwqK of YwqJK toxin-antitoxin module